MQGEVKDIGEKKKKTFGEHFWNGESFWMGGVG